MSLRQQIVTATTSAYQAKMIAQSAMASNARAMEQLEKIQRNRAELRDMLSKLETDVRALEEKRGLAPPPIPQVNIPVSSPVHPLPSVFAERRPMPSPPVHQQVEERFDISKVDPIFREAAKDPALRIRFMDCTDLAMQCALIRQKA